MSLSNTDSDNSIESKDSHMCSLLEYNMEDEYGDLQITPVMPSKSKEPLTWLMLMSRWLMKTA